MHISTSVLPPIALLALMLTTCAADPSPIPTNGPQSEEGGKEPSSEFRSYWYQGEGEIGRYALTQARYGELRQGDAVLVFVTEEFLTDIHVKYEGESDGPRTTVLKLNRIDRFNTGIYDYSLMTSVFSPVEDASVLKTTCSVQDWCGQAFMQLDQRAPGFELESRSYFESEGDRMERIPPVFLEDGVWNQIRIDPNTLPQGEIDILPALSYLRLTHKPHEAVEAYAELKMGADSSAYRIEFLTLKRVLEIHFSSDFPHAILGWNETRPDGFGDDEQMLTTTATRAHSIMEPYWQLNRNAHDSLRTTLGLPRMPVKP